MNVIDRHHNSPPDPIDEALRPYGDAIAESDGWLDGTPVQDEAQMKAVDALLKEIKAARKAVTEAEESEAKPIYDAWKSAKARFAPTIADLDARAKGLAKIGEAFKRALAEKQEAARREAARIAAQAAEAARKAAEAADESNIATVQAAQQAAYAADLARAQATKAAQDKVTGLRTVTLHEVTDHRALLHYIAASHREDVTAFVDEWARVHHRDYPAAPGLRVWQEKRAI